MLYREIIAVCSQIHTKHTNTLCGQNVELLNVKAGDTYSDHSPRNGYNTARLISSNFWHNVPFIHLNCQITPKFKLLLHPTPPHR